MANPLRRSPRNHKGSARSTDTHARAKAGPSSSQEATSTRPSVLSRAPLPRTILPPEKDNTMLERKVTKEQEIAAAPAAGSAREFILVRLLGKVRITVSDLWRG